LPPATRSRDRDEEVLRTARRDELPLLSELVARFQSRAEARIGYFGSSKAEIAAEIEDWGEDWPEQCLVAVRGGEIAGFVGVEIDHELGRAWIYGPYAEDDHWDTLADRLYLGIAARAGVEDLELVGDAAHERLADLAARHGFSRGRQSFTLAIDRERVAELPPVVLPRLGEDQRAAFSVLHESLFPGTYYSGAQLVEQSARGEATALVLLENDRLVGYAVGRVHSSGEGYVDFLGVVEDARSAGRGRRLVS
jgi:ribosomal protein S18 acetylase RimI-like enzyme